MSQELVLSELKQHLGTESDFCYPSPAKECERGISTYELSLLHSIHDQNASEANRNGLCNIFLLNVPTHVQYVKPWEMRWRIGRIIPYVARNVEPVACFCRAFDELRQYFHYRSTTRETTP